MVLSTSHNVCFLDKARPWQKIEKPYLLSWQLATGIIIVTSISIIINLKTKQGLFVGGWHAIVIFIVIKSIILRQSSALTRQRIPICWGDNLPLTSISVENRANTDKDKDPKHGHHQHTRICICTCIFLHLYLNLSLLYLFFCIYYLYWPTLSFENRANLDKDKDPKHGHQQHTRICICTCICFCICTWICHFVFVLWYLLFIMTYTLCWKPSKHRQRQRS